MELCRRRRVRRWTYGTAAGMLFLVALPLTAGPMPFLLARGWLGPPLGEYYAAWVYWPLREFLADTPLEGPVDSLTSAACFSRHRL